jgi:hypothetical protein
MKFETRSKRRFGNVVERAVILCDGETFSVDETLLPRKSNQLSGPQVSRAGVLADDKKESPSLCYGRLQRRANGTSSGRSQQFFVYRERRSAGPLFGPNSTDSPYGSVYPLGPLGL